MSEPTGRIGTIRRADPADAARLVDLLETPGSSKRSEPAWRAWLGEPTTLTLIAETTGGAVAGFLDTRQAADEAEVIDLWVTPHARRNGIAAALLENLTQHLKAYGGTRLFLEVALDNTAARALYEKQGFATVAHRGAYYARAEADPVDALVMVRPIGSK
jgi:ribosomal protein S18 acetylase RimI-like enzyme